MSGWLRRWLFGWDPPLDDGGWHQVAMRWRDGRPVSVVVDGYRVRRGLLRRR